jgi:hypothetical protein
MIPFRITRFLTQQDILGLGFAILSSARSSRLGASYYGADDNAADLQRHFLNRAMVRPAPSVP